MACKLTENLLRKVKWDHKMATRTHRITRIRDSETRNDHARPTVLGDWAGLGQTGERGLGRKSQGSVA